MKKTSVLLSVILFAQLGHAGWGDLGDLIEKGIGAFGGKVNCNANYLETRAGVFGSSNKSTQELIQADSASQACEIAKSKDSRSAGVFGENSRQLVGMSCTNKKKISFQVDIDTCEVKL